MVRKMKQVVPIHYLLPGIDKGNRNPTSSTQIGTRTLNSGSRDTSWYLNILKQILKTLVNSYSQYDYQNISDTVWYSTQTKGCFFFLSKNDLSVELHKPNCWSPYLESPDNFSDQK